ncbi:uncharacterized protein LOC123292277 [Chrysoperla carnea]|uniref:uncharacterized protein LOC123292277 n=1 Tax=Chrysoperla carnea TaxID=189513 RepID=UPI001D0932B7|nr:uncharacterized protein LOC123292277 [Chrysoperla carnea]
MNKSNKKRENKSSKDSKSTEGNPKDQRERKPRPVIPTNVTINPKNETVEVDFSNLKKETDEIKRLTEPSKYSKREISSNWSRYEKNEYEDEFTSAADFSSLLQAPVSGGGHFQFKSEKHWDEKIKSHYSEYFSLNLKTINDGILSIPFYERHCINSALLNDNQIIHMNNDALRYQNKLNINEKKKSKQAATTETTADKGIIISDQSIEDDQLNNDNKDEFVDIDEIAEKFVHKVNTLLNVDDLLELTEDSKSIDQENNELKIKQHDISEPNYIDDNSIMGNVTERNFHEEPACKEPKKMTNTTVDLEQWLDNILDD